VLKFKYKPRVVNGETVEVEGVQNRLTFELGG
jgi:protein TonB